MARPGESELALVALRHDSPALREHKALAELELVRVRRSSAHARFIPAAIVARPWDFDLPPGSKPPKPVLKQVAPVLKLHRGATE